MESFGIIYKATNTENGKAYIGQTVRPLAKRINRHASRAKTSKLRFGLAIMKYGIDKFQWSILEQCENQTELDEMEFHFIKQFKSIEPEFGYNLSLGGSGVGYNASKNPNPNPRSGFQLSEEHKKKIGEANSGSNNGMHKSNGRVNHMQGKCGPLSPWWGIRGEKSPHSKTYKIITPEGEEIQVTGLKQYCRDNALNNGAMAHNAKTANGKTHKGYRAFLLE